MILRETLKITDFPESFCLGAGGRRWILMGSVNLADALINPWFLMAGHPTPPGHVTPQKQRLNKAFRETNG